jgi:hypothetical protein
MQQTPVFLHFAFGSSAGSNQIQGPKQTGHIPDNSRPSVSRVGQYRRLRRCPLIAGRPMAH